MSVYTNLFNSSNIDNIETLNAISGTVDSLTCSSSNIINGTYQSLYVGSMTNDNSNISNLTIKNLNFQSDSNITKGDYVYTLQDKTGIIAHLDDIKMPENMVTTDTDQTITGQKLFTKSVGLGDGLLIGDKEVIFQDKSGVVSLKTDLDSYVTLNTTQTLGGFKTYNNVVKFNSSFYNSENKIITLPSNGGQLALKTDLNTYVNLTSDQTITGKKTFNSETTINNYLNLDALRLKAGSFTFDDMTIYKPLQSGGLVVWGDMFDYLTLKNLNQTVLGEKTFSLRTKFMNGFNNGTYDIDMPNKSGVISLTSDLDNYVTLNNVNQTINGIKTFSNLVMFQNGISNGAYNYTFTGKSGRLLIDDDFNILNSIVSLTKNDVTVLQDDVKVINDDIKVINNDIILIKNDVTTLQNDVIIIKDDVKTIQNTMPVGSRIVYLDEDQNIDSKKTFLKKSYFNAGLEVTDDVQLTTGHILVNHNATISNTLYANNITSTGNVTCNNGLTVSNTLTTDNIKVDDLVVNNNINCNGNLEINGGICKALSNRYTDLNASVSKIIHLDFGSNYSFSFSGKIMITGYVEQNRSKVFYLEYLVWGGRNGPYGDFYDHELIHQKDNTSSNKFVTFGFNSIANNYIKYLVSTRSTTTKTSFIINCDITYFSDASGNLTIRFIDA